MKLEDLDLPFDNTLMARYPLPKRDEARLMIVNRSTGKITHHRFREITQFFGEGDVLITNNSKVAPYQLTGQKYKNACSIETILLHELDPIHNLWDAWLEPARKIRISNKLLFGTKLFAEVIDNTSSGNRTLKFTFDGDRRDLHAYFAQIGKPPFPKLLGRSVEPEDQSRYQTIYATEQGGLVPPYAGFHWSPYLFKKLAIQGVHFTQITQHLNLKELEPIVAKEIYKHVLNPLFFEVSKTAAELVNKAKQRGNKVISVGTSTLKTIESSISVDQGLRPQSGWTNRFFLPGHKFKLTDALLTNFQLPNMVSFVDALAFGGKELIMEAYRIAIREKYRFFVYGDALFIH